MKEIAQLKGKIMGCLLKKDLENMSIAELDRFIELVGKTSVIQDRNFTEEYAEIIKGLIPEKKDLSVPMMMGIGTLGNS